MSAGPATTDSQDRKDLPVEDEIARLQKALDSMAAVQSEGQRALRAVLDHVERREAEMAAATERAEAEDESAPAPREDRARPAPWEDPHGEVRPATPAASTRTPSAPDAELRRCLAGLNRAASEVDRRADAEALQAYLWDFARSRGLRAMRLQEKGRALYAEDAFGFRNFEGDRRGRLRKVVVPFDPDAIFGATAQDRAVYSGPRPSRGLPVDLVLVMGKKAPDWCLVIPLPYRNRWGTFLYVDSIGNDLRDILELEMIARLVVLQLRAARVRPHEPADRVRAFRTATLRERKKKRARQKGTLASDRPPPAGPGDDAAADPLSRKRGRRGPMLGEPIEEDRFDADGNLIHPLDGNEILARIGDLPAMPHVAARLIGLLNDPATEIKQLQEIISTDQSIAVRLMQIANSSLYASMQEAQTIAEAIMRLGFTAIRSWLLSTVTRQVFVGSEATATGMLLWRQSVINAIGAEIVARHTGAMDPEAAFVGGLMQNVGLLVLARSHPDVFDEIDARARAAELPYVDLERRILGFDHADVSGILLQRWGLGDGLIDAVSAHHRLETVSGDARTFAAIIALAEDLALRLGEGPTETRADDLAGTPAALQLELDAEALEPISEEIATRALDSQLFGD